MKGFRVVLEVVSGSIQVRAVVVEAGDEGTKTMFALHLGVFLDLGRAKAQAREVYKFLDACGLIGEIRLVEKGQVTILSEDQE